MRLGEKHVKRKVVREEEVFVARSKVARYRWEGVHAPGAISKTSRCPHAGTCRDFKNIALSFVAVAIRRGFEKGIRL